MKTGDIQDLRKGSSSLNRDHLYRTDFIKKAVKTAGNVAVELLFPQKCPVCGDAIPIENRLYKPELSSGLLEGGPLMAAYDALICRDCRKELALIRDPVCEKCGKQLYAGEEERLCHDCREKIRSFLSCRCMLIYDELTRDIISAVKYNSKREYIDLLSLMAAERYGGWIKGLGVRFIIPVPVHPSRLKKRGYNQAELMALGIGRLLNIPVENKAVIRTKQTLPQKELDRDSRLKNLQNAFQTVPDTIKRIRSSFGDAVSVLVVDDIYTTGATLDLVSLSLISSGITKVYGLCMCGRHIILRFPLK